MAQRDTRLNIDVTAEDRASSVIRDVQADVDKLEQSDAKVDVGADDNASTVIDAVQADARDLDGTKASVDVQADDNASKTIEAVDSDRKDLDGSKAEVTVGVDDNATRVLDNIDAKLRELDNRRATIGVGGAVAAGAAAGAVAGAGIPVVGDIAAGARNAADYALQVQQIATMTGSSLEDASRLASLWKSSGFDLNDLLDILGQIQQVIRQQPDLASQLNLSTANDGITTFLQAVRNIQTEFDTAGDRANAASQLFGEEGVRQVGRVQTQVGDLDKAMDAVSDTQLIDPADVERARQLSQRSSEMAQDWQRIQLFALQAASAIDNYFRAVYRAGQNQPNISGGDIVDFFAGDRTSNGPVPGGQRGQGVLTRIDAPSRGRGGDIIVINPPGSPTTVVNDELTYTRRNDSRLS